jgi:hypothetical protein
MMQPTFSRKTNLWVDYFCRIAQGYQARDVHEETSTPDTILCGLVAANVLVWLAWQESAWEPFMRKHFLVSPEKYIITSEWMIGTSSSPASTSDSSKHDSDHWINKAPVYSSLFAGVLLTSSSCDHCP